MKTPCNICKHLFQKSIACSAFPSGIPTKYFTGLKDHDKVDSEQKNKIVFEPIEIKEKP